MVQKLALIAIAGLAASAACIGAAAAIGGGRFADALVGPFGREDCETVASATATSRDMDWDGSDQAGMAIPAIGITHQAAVTSCTPPVIPRCWRIYASVVALLNWIVMAGIAARRM